VRWSIISQFGNDWAVERVEGNEKMPAVSVNAGEKM